MAGGIRTSAIAGSWYPGNPAALTRDITNYLGQVVLPEPAGVPVVIISPHAGYIYSGPVAAYAYKAVSSHGFKRVVVISPSHRAYFPFIALWGSGAYETPLGQVPIDNELCQALQKQTSLIQEDSRPHVPEHALEIQLPFLQTVLGEFTLCPLIMGEQGLPMCRALAEALDACITDPGTTLVVASTDLSHFHAADKAGVMDRKLAQLIESYDVDGLARALEIGSSEACGGGPIMAAMLYARAKGHSSTRILKYAHSGDITGDRSSVVGYLAAAIY